MAMMSGPTVYDRAKKTGYIMGPRHAMGAAVDDGASPNVAPAQDQREDVPPNLRDADGPGSCGDCTHFDGRNACSLHGGYAVTANQVCDDYEHAGDDEIGADTEGV